MSAEANDEGHLRKYLLGELDEADQQAFEERLMTETELFALLPVVEDELIEDYLGELLSSDERGRFESLFVSTAERRRKLSFAMAFKRYVTTEGAADVGAESPTLETVTAKPPPRTSAGASSMIGHASWWNRAFSSPYLRMAAAAVIVLGLGLGIWRMFFYQSEVEKGMYALSKAYATERPVEPRITGFGYAPFPVTRGNEPSKVDSRWLYSAERTLFDEAEKRPSAMLHHALGRLYLAEQKFEDASREFDEALKTDSANAQLHSDYGALLIEIGKRENTGKNLEVLARALEHLNKALELDASFLDPLFNRALCYQYMFLRHQAEEDWRRYLEKDPTSQWASEAKKNLKEIEDHKERTTQSRGRLFQDFIRAYEERDDEVAWRTLSQARIRAGNFIVARLVDDLLGSVPIGRTEVAGSTLEILSYAGELENQKASDCFTKDLARFYKTASPHQRQTAYEARSLMAAAREKSQQVEYEKAIELYSRGKQLFQDAGNRCEAAFAATSIAISNSRINPTECLRVLEPLFRPFEKQGYRWLLGQCLSTKGDAQTSLREFSKTLDSGRLAYQLSEQLEDPHGMLSNLQLPVGIYQQLGEYSKSLDDVLNALRLASSFSPDAREIWPFYQQAAFNLESLGLITGALEFQRESLRLALETGIPLLKSRSYARLGWLNEKLREYDEAIRNGQLALAEGQNIIGKRSRDNIVANSTLNLAHMYKERGDFSKAVAHYDQAIQIHDELNLQLYLFEAHKGKLLALLGLRDDGAAEEEVKKAVAAIEQYRNRISEESNRNSFFELAQDIYDIATNFAYSRMGNAQQAYDYAEASHARSLLDLIKTNARAIQVQHAPDMKLNAVAPILSLSEIRQQLPGDLGIVEYSLLDDRILCWVISKNGFEHTEQRIAADALSKKIHDYLALISNPNRGVNEETTSAARDLFDLLIGPVEQFLGDKSYLCIIPDKSLNYFPFGSLISPTSGKYFMQEHLYVLAPSANVFLAASEAASKKAETASERLLAVGNPSFDHGKFSDLRSAAREAREIANYYNSTPLLGERAREKRVKDEMSQADVIHLASHYVVNDRSPMLSGLLLAKEAGFLEQKGEDGVLQASEIYDMQLTRTRLVVLSACQTANEQSIRGEGSIGVARPFLKAGVPLVVASLWPIDSGATAELMISFHKHRKQEKRRTVDALRLSQLDMLGSAERAYHHPYYWASFVVIGGYAKF